jgi:hypothetical protein
MELIRTLTYDSGSYKQLYIANYPFTTSLDEPILRHLEFTADLDPTLISPTPFTIRYCSDNTVPNNTNSNVPFQVQLDGGANSSITNNSTLLSRYQPTDSYAIYGVNKDEIALTCTGRGYIPWRANNGDTVYVPCYYSPDAAETIISPTDVVMSHPHLFSAWGQFAHIPTGHGHVTFYRTEGTNHSVYPLRMYNGLWYNDTPILKCINSPPNKSKSPRAVAHRLICAARFELWHQRACHCGKQKLQSLHKHVHDFH